jgi:PEP-CTERM motif
MKAPLFTALLIAAGAAHAQATAPTLTSRLSAVVGSFTVGYATLGDGGSFNETLRTLDASFSRNEADSGSASGVVGSTPVQGSAGFAVTQDYAVTPLLISAAGSGATAADTPYSYVSVGARTISQLRFSFTVLVPTPFVLTGDVQHTIGDPVQGLTPTALATARLQSATGGGGLWRSDTSPGAFTTSGTFMPGFSYTLEGLANSNLNASSSFVMNLVLSPVPEPAAWALLSAGLGLMLWRRRVAPQEPRA